MLQGISYILLACLVWGTIFVIPRFMPDFTSFEVALVRYLFYGLVSVLLLAYGRLQLLWQVERQLWIKALWLGFAGNIIYYFALVVCMRNAGGGIAALMLGVSPITIAWYGNWKKRESRFRNLILPSLATAIGLALVNLPVFEKSASEGSLGNYCIGLLAGFLALGLWTWYAVTSKVVLSRHPSVSPSDWSTVLGTATLLSVIVVTAGYLVWDTHSLDRFGRWNSELQDFLIGGAFLGILCSWMGFYLWSKGNLYIPVALAGQLLIFEALFGLAYVHLLDARLPLAVEWIGMLFMLVGIVTAIQLTRQERAAQTLVTDL
jgi:drug/metabolite transporter (DMT)-like permease